jgi:hypothetical protein
MKKLRMVVSVLLPFFSTEYDKAIPDFDKAIELMPTGAYGVSAYAGRGMSLSR